MLDSVGLSLQWFWTAVVFSNYCSEAKYPIRTYTFADSWCIWCKTGLYIHLQATTKQQLMFMHMASRSDFFVCF